MIQHRKKLRPLLVGVILYASALSAKADLFEPFSTSNLNPFTQSYGLPNAKSATLPSATQWQFGLQTDAANNFTQSNSALENINIDGETYRATLSVTRGLTDRLSLGLDVPYVRHQGGSFDHFIEDWHKLFGLPNGGREDVRQDNLDYQYQSGAEKFRLNHSTGGIGDARFHLGYQFGQSASRQWAIRAGVKLPTGNKRKLLGSGSTDLFASVHLNDNNLIKHPDWAIRAHVGALAIGDGDVLKKSVEDWVIYGSGTLAWQAWENVSLKAQLDYHSPFFDSDLEELGDPSAQLILGGTIRLSGRSYLDISVSEDIITNTAPDVVFQIGLTTSLH
ncbi:MAG: hypothetical protein ACI8Z1_000267 [Candidatus Azotimanducaceae bacterium]|jgi:hypothetical protein